MARERRLLRVLPGLLVLVGLAILARVLADAAGVSALIVAVVLGAVLTNAVRVPEVVRPGLSLGSLALETGIVLLGASIALDDVVASGPVVVALVVATVTLGIVCVELLARRVFDLRSKTTSLLAAGSSICGVSAAVAIAGTIDADSEDLTHVIATVLLFDAVTLVAFPLAGEWLVLSGKQFGVWVGLSMFSTGPVAAAGFAHSAVAGRWATVTKLTRNSLLGVVAVVYAAVYLRRDTSETDVARLWSDFPKFLIGFLLVALVANAGVLSPGTLASIDTASGWLFSVAFVGLGFDVRLSKMRDAGFTPILVVTCQLALVSVLAFLAVTVLL